MDLAVTFMLGWHRWFAAKEAPAEGSQPLNPGASLTRNHFNADMEYLCPFCP